jgi:hypothetical protein
LTAARHWSCGLLIGPEHAHSFALAARCCCLFVFKTELFALVIVAPIGHGTPSGPIPG